MTCLNLIKKDGTKEDFNTNKIIEISKKVGISNSKANLLIKRVKKQIQELKSSKLRDLIYENLKKMKPQAVERYRKFYVKQDY